LKNNLKTKYSPPVLYTKGNDRLLNERAVAVVGSRQASPFSLEFADRIADKVVKEDSVIVSGFAQGVDKQALDSTLGHHGRSIIVLPQGIMTFSSGLKQYYQHIWEGDVLVLSTFLPKARWSTALAMARNPIIYGLAEEIYVAECQEKGGTWAGAIDGLRKGRTIYVRRPDPSESNANELLIARGAIEVELGMYSHSPQVLHVMETSDKAPIWDNELVKRIVELLTHSKKLSAKAIMEKLSLKIDKKDLIKLLESTPNFERSTDKKYKLKAIEKPDQPRLL
jgi:DNA protecting protein DprA